LQKPVRQCPREAAVWHVSSVTVPLRYEFPLSAQIHCLKYLSGRNLGRALGLILAEYLRGCVDPSTVDAIVPVPLHRSRLVNRGYNQALEIALPVAAEFNLPVILAGIDRSRHGVPQSALGLEHRRVNVTNAFSVSKNLTGHRLAVIDDVITTGATINALAVALRRAGAVDVHAWAVARTL
jgi:ComF family protein